MGHGLECGNAGGVAGSGRGNFPSLGCVIPVWFRENQRGWTFLAQGIWEGSRMSLECQWNIIPNSKRNNKGITKPPRNEDLSLGTPSP